MDNSSSDSSDINVEFISTKTEVKSALQSQRSKIRMSSLDHAPPSLSEKLFASLPDQKQMFDNEWLDDAIEVCAKNIGSAPDYPMMQFGYPMYPMMQTQLQKLMQLGTNPAASSVIQDPCTICHDRSTGKHYGAVSCDGCKGFFRRSVRKRTHYTCRFIRCCVINKDKRNQCRYCRLKKCFRAGMRQEAVQKETDNPTRWTMCGDPEDLGDKGLDIEVLSRIEMHYKAVSSFGKIPLAEPKSNITFQEIIEALKEPLLFNIEWMKAVVAFDEMRQDDRIALLTSNPLQWSILETARKSLNVLDLVVFSSSIVTTRTGQEPELGVLITQILDEVIQPLRTLALDECEFSCLKAISFFDPFAKNLTDRARVKQIRSFLQLSLDDYMAGRQEQEGTGRMKGRFGQSLLLLTRLQEISFDMLRVLCTANSFGKIRAHPFIQEMLFGGFTMTQFFPPGINGPPQNRELPQYFNLIRILNTPQQEADFPPSTTFAPLDGNSNE